MRVLWVSPVLPYPANDGGRIRTYQLLKRISAIHDVCLVCPTTPTESDLPLPVSKRTFVPATATPAHRVRHLINPRPYLAALSAPSTAVGAVNRGLREWGPDVVVVEHGYMASALPRALHVPLVVDFHNIDSNRLRAAVRTKKDPLRAILGRIEYLKMDWWERQVASRARGLAAVSALEAEILSGYNPGADTTVIPNGVDPALGTLVPDRETPDELLFVGSLSYYANIDAVKFFVYEVLPRLVRARPTIRFTIVGREPSPQVKALESVSSHVRVVGEVPDVRPYLESASVVVLPMRQGGGTNLKMVEAMAAGKGIVATTFACRGFNVKSGREVLVTDEPEEFAACVLKLLSDTPLRRHMGAQARRYALDGYCWPAIGDRFCDLLERVAEPTRLS